MVLAPLMLLAACGSNAEPAARGPGTPAASSTSPSNGESSQPQPSETVSSATATTTAPERLVVATRRSPYGTVLFDGSGRAIYLFEKESTERPECYQGCAKAWPPVLVTDIPQAAGKARADLFGLTDRSGGASQLTYDGNPLYYYLEDGPGEIRCHDVVEFGGLWLVVTPSGAGAPGA